MRRPQIELANADPDLFRDVFRRVTSHIPSGVAIVAGLDPRQGPFGLTISSLTPLSVEPPLVSICVDRTSARATQLRQIGRFSVNLLEENQAELARLFATPGADRFDGLRWSADEFGAPVLDGVVGVMFCEMTKEVDAGDHQVFISEVIRLVLHDGKPLVYWRRGFYSLKLRYPFLRDQETLEKFVRDWEAGTLPRSNWTHRAHVAVAAYYAFDRPAEAAFQMTKAGILHYNACVGTANTEDSGYHETLTRFWAKAVGGFVRGRHFGLRLEAVRQAVGLFGEDRDRHRLYYSFDVVRDRRARREWIPPDRVPPLEARGGRMSTST